MSIWGWIILWVYVTVLALAWVLAWKWRQTALAWQRTARTAITAWEETQAARKQEAAITAALLDVCAREGIAVVLEPGPGPSGDVTITKLPFHPDSETRH